MAAHRYRLLGTTADVALVAWGGTPAELFENAAYGLTRAIALPVGVRTTEARTVKVEADDLEELLVAWLSEWLYLFDAEGFIGREFEIHEVSDKKAVGSGMGDIYRPETHRLRMGIKGITYHGLEIRRQRQRLRARVVVDI